MRCRRCIALVTQGYEYPEEVCLAGVPDENLIEFKNGDTGCRLSPKTIKKRIDKENKLFVEQYKFIGEYFKEVEYKDDGIDINDPCESFIEKAMKCIGLDLCKPYTRNGKKYYKAIRNYYILDKKDVDLEVLSDIGYAKAEYLDNTRYELTEAGANWLGRELGVVIRL